MLRWKGVLVVAPMTNEELVERIQSGDADCIEQLLQNNQEYLYKLARRFSRDAGAVEDLVQEGGIAILDAAGSYEPEYGALFLTYATPMIRKAMRDYMAGMSLPMAIPAARYSQLRRVNYLVAKFQAEGESHSLQDLLMMICRSWVYLKRLREDCFGTTVRFTKRPYWMSIGNGIFLALTLTRLKFMSKSFWLSVSKWHWTN